MTKIPSEEIYIDLYYENKNGNFEVNENILKILKNSLGFKWIKLENKIGERFQKMCIKLSQYNFDNLKKIGLKNNIEIDFDKDLFSFNSNSNNNMNSNILSPINNISNNNDNDNNSNLIIFDGSEYNKQEKEIINNNNKNIELKILKKYKHSLEITSNCIIKIKNNDNGFSSENFYNQIDSDAAGNDIFNKDNYIEENKFEENVNFFLVLHSLLNLNNIEDYKINGDLLNKIDSEKFKVSIFIIYINYKSYN
jgi:hypothetical protein